jgi:hypothetical protein
MLAERWELDSNLRWRRVLLLISCTSWKNRITFGWLLIIPYESTAGMARAACQAKN